ILAKIQCPPTDDPNARKARVDSLFSPPRIEFLNSKISNASAKIETFGSTNKQKIIDNMLVLSCA
ncbi:MAG: hypothetical protein P1U70_09535, partial [Saprospiraceae bacterium]|nr:hypothetical protein [Saprospiraceae bacterium]